jgi:hypothetical protein
LQVTGFTNNPPSVKIRYKLVQNGDAPKTSSAVGILTIGRNPDVLRVQLTQAEDLVASFKQMSEVSLIPTAHLEAAQDKVDVLKAELEGDDVRVAQARLAAAQHALRRVSQLMKIGAVPSSEAEAAQAEVQVREAELKAAQAAQGGRASLGR